jgi:hypothetical protein
MVLIQDMLVGATGQANADGKKSIGIHAVVVHHDDPKRVYVANDVGVFASLNRGKPWRCLTRNLPNVPVVDLVYHETDKTLTCAWRITSHAAIKVRGSSRIYRFRVKFGLSAWLSAVSMLILAALFPSSGLGMRKRW